MKYVEFEYLPKSKLLYKLNEEANKLFVITSGQVYVINPPVDNQIPLPKDIED